MARIDLTTPADAERFYRKTFNGIFPDECLNDHWFETLPQAMSVIAAWRRDFDEVRPHSRWNWMPPAEFAALYRHRAESKYGPTDSIYLLLGLRS